MPYLEKKVISVTDFTKLINLLVSDIAPVWIEGEVIGFKNWKDRVVFFDIKDESSLLHCSFYYSRLQSSGINLEDGMKVKIIGEPQLRANRGEFALNVKELQLSGEGSFKKAYELLKKKLQEEGLFERKRKIPDFVKNIGVITSKNGAVIHDFVKNLKQVNYKIYFYDTLVEGERSAPSITKAIKWFNENMPNLDVIVIMRGGGSLEALQGFNNEILARTIYSSKIPTLAGIGHEIDVPLASLIADFSVSTPTATANYINQSWDSLQENIPYWEERILNQFTSSLNTNIRKITDLAQRIILSFNQIFNTFDVLVKDFDNIISILQNRKKEIGEKINTIKEKLIFYIEKAIQEKELVIINQEKYLQALDPEKNLKLGYSIILNQDSRILKGIDEIKKGDIITTKLYKGSFLSEVNKINK